MRNDWATHPLAPSYGREFDEFTSRKSFELLNQIGVPRLAEMLRLTGGNVKHMEEVWERVIDTKKTATNRYNKAIKHYNDKMARWCALSAHEQGVQERPKEPTNPIKTHGEYMDDQLRRGCPRRKAKARATFAAPPRQPFPIGEHGAVENMATHAASVGNGNKRRKVDNGQRDEGELLGSTDAEAKISDGELIRFLIDALFGDVPDDPCRGSNPGAIDDDLEPGFDLGSSEWHLEAIDIRV